MNETRALLNRILDDIEETDEIGERKVEKYDLLKYLSGELLSDIGRFDLAVYLLHRCGRSDLADKVEKSGR